MSSDAMQPSLIVTEADNILVMRINMPRVKNALNLEVLRLLAEAYTTLSNSGDLRCGVVCGEGRRLLRRS
jgi:enoyl-CoA hydratase